MKFLIIILILLPLKIYARDDGQTEITTDEGIEVFQNEKYYLLKKNVRIISDSFQLTADIVKAYFDKDLYDIIKIESEGNVKLSSDQGIDAKGHIINFSTKTENISVLGKNSYLNYKEIRMSSNNLIEVNNLLGKFTLKGNDSKLISSDIEIYGDLIEGNYENINQINEINKLFVSDNEVANIKTKKINMFALKAKYNKKENIIELFDNVKVIRGNEIIVGDYANINTLDESYKVKSNNKTKVKVLINQPNE